MKTWVYISWKSLKLRSKPIPGLVQWHYIWNFTCKIRGNLTSLKILLPTLTSLLWWHIWEFMLYWQYERIKINSLLICRELFLWEWWELPKAEVKFQIWMGSFWSLASVDSVRSTSLKELMPPRVRNLLSGDKRLNIYIFLALSWLLLNRFGVSSSQQTLHHTFRNYSLMNDS